MAVVAVVLDTPAVVEAHHKIRHRRFLLSKTSWTWSSHEWCHSSLVVVAVVAVVVVEA